MRYCGLHLKGNVFLAPIYDYTNVGFRLLCRKYGADLCYSEMIHVDSFKVNEDHFLNFPEIDKPIAGQIVGSNIENIAYAAKTLSDYVDILDINFGCPMEKEFKTNCGAALLKKPLSIKKIVETAVKHSKVPVTAKMRIAGTLKDTVKIGKIIEKSGASAITLHARKVNEGYDAIPNLSAIKELKEKLSIPVAGNGGIDSYEKYKEMTEKTSCDAIMIGRAAIGNPLIFKELKEKKKLKTDAKIQSELLKEYISLDKKYNEGYDFLYTKRHALSFIRGFSGAAELRGKISCCKSEKEILSLLKDL